MSEKLFMSERDDSFRFAVNQALCKVTTSLIDNEVCAVDYETSQRHDSHALSVALLTPKFTFNELFDGQLLPTLHLRLVGVQRVRPYVVEVTCKEAGAYLTEKACFFPLLFLEKIHHEDVKTTIVKT